MASGIDVFFAGLMLICFDGQRNCPSGPYAGAPHRQHTAWVIKADGPSMVCGRYSREETILTIKFLEASFRPLEPQEDMGCTKDERGYKTCVLPAKGDICLILNRNYPQVTKYLERLPKLSEIDRRFLELDTDRLRDPDYVPARIQFPHGEIAGWDLWPQEGNPTLWYRSAVYTDEVLPRYLSDRLKVGYIGASRLQVRYCGGENKNILELVRNPKALEAEVVFQNFTKDIPHPDRGRIYDALAYLVWYYRLGKWGTGNGRCPTYNFLRKDAVLLQCVSKREEGCAYDLSANRDTRFWPPMLMPQ